MKNDCFQIGEVSKITGISKDTLHFYSKIGLVVPDHIDPDNQYRYYSRWNMWQLDIVSTCRKLSVPLEKVRELMSYHDNEKIVELLSEYRKEAIRLSEYYQQVAEDIEWYQSENQKINACRREMPVKIERKHLSKEYVVMGSRSKGEEGYHAELQNAVKEILRSSDSIQKKYGYVLNISELHHGRIIKEREYMKLCDIDLSAINKECLYALPSGDYAVFTANFQRDSADFQPLFQWLQENHAEADIIFAEEIGLQLFDYLPDYYCEVKAHLKNI